MTFARFLTAAILAAAGVPADAQTRDSFCVARELVVFSCRTGQKQVSVCASEGATATQGSLSYRFGNPAEGALDLELPKAATVPSKAAQGGVDAFSGGGGAWLMFRQGEFTYAVYTGIGNWGPKGEKREKAGLLVQRAGKDMASLKCVGHYASELGPDLYDRLGIQKGNVEFFDYPD